MPSNDINDLIFLALSTWAVANQLVVDATNVQLTSLPTSDPHIAGLLWNSSGTVKVSAG